MSFGIPPCCIGMSGETAPERTVEELAPLLGAGVEDESGVAEPPVR